MSDIFYVNWKYKNDKKSREEIKISASSEEAAINKAKLKLKMSEFHWKGIAEDRIELWIE